MALSLAFSIVFRRSYRYRQRGQCGICLVVALNLAFLIFFGKAKDTGSEDNVELRGILSIYLSIYLSVRPSVRYHAEFRTSVRPLPSAFEDKAKLRSFVLLRGEPPLPSACRRYCGTSLQWLRYRFFDIFSTKLKIHTALSFFREAFPDLQIQSAEDHAELSVVALNFAF